MVSGLGVDTHCLTNKKKQMEKRKKQQQRLLTKLYRMQSDLEQLRDFYEDVDSSSKMMKRIHRMQHRVVYFIDCVTHDC